MLDIYRVGYNWRDIFRTIWCKFNYVKATMRRCNLILTADVFSHYFLYFRWADMLCSDCNFDWDVCRCEVGSERPQDQEMREHGEQEIREEPLDRARPPRVWVRMATPALCP